MIDILIAVDGQQLRQKVADGAIKPGTQTSPTYLGDWQQSDVFISMTAQNSVVVNDGGQSELTVKANSGDTIRWSMQTFDGNVDTTAYLYNGGFIPTANITPLVYFRMQSSSYLPAGAPTSAPGLVHNYSYVAQATVIEPGAQIQYALSFALVDNATGNVIGHFYWDPFIQVSR